MLVRVKIGMLKSFLPYCSVKNHSSIRPKSVRYRNPTSWFTGIKTRIPLDSNVNCGDQPSPSVGSSFKTLAGVDAKQKAQAAEGVRPRARCALGRNQREGFRIGSMAIGGPLMVFCAGPCPLCI